MGSGCHEDEAKCRCKQAEADLKPKTRFLEMPLGHVHGDYTVRSGFTRARQLLEPYCTAKEIDAALAREGSDDGEGLLLSPSISIARALIEHWHAGMRARSACPPAETGR